MSYFLVAPNGTKVPLPVQPLRFGSDVSADVRLSSKLGLAPMHFVLQPNGAGFTLETLTPGFPVFVNEQPADNQDLKSGDSIRAGAFCVKYESEQTIDHLAPPPEYRPMPVEGNAPLPEPTKAESIEGGSPAHYLVPPPEQRPMSFGSLPTLPPPLEFTRPGPPPAAVAPQESPAALPPAEAEAPPLHPLGSAFFASLPEQGSEPQPSPATLFPAQNPLPAEPLTPQDADSSPPALSWSQRAEESAPVTAPQEFRLFTQLPPVRVEETLAHRAALPLPPLPTPDLAARRDPLPIPLVEKAKGRWSARSVSAKLAVLGSAIAVVYTFLLWGALEGFRPVGGSYTPVSLLKIFCYLAATTGIGWSAGSIVALVDRVIHPNQQLFVVVAVMFATATAAALLALPITPPSGDGLARMVAHLQQAPSVLVPGYDWRAVAEKASEPWSLLGIVIATLAAYLRSHREAR